MRVLLTCLILGSLCACSKSRPEPATVDNPATRHADHLRHSLDRAQDAADKFNQSTAEREAQRNRVEESSE